MIIRPSAIKKLPQEPPKPVVASLAVGVFLIGLSILFVSGWWLKQQLFKPAGFSVPNSFGQSSPLESQDSKASASSEQVASSLVQPAGLNVYLSSAEIMRIADDQSRRLQDELQNNEALPKEDRSMLAPSPETIQAVEQGKVFLE